MVHRSFPIFVLIVLVHALAGNRSSAATINLDWITQFVAPNTGYDVDTDDSGGVYVTGESFLAKFDPAGAPVWIIRPSIGGVGSSYSIASTEVGESYIAGASTGDFAGPNQGSQDAIIAKYDPHGVLLWGRQFGGSLPDQANAISLDGFGNPVVAGITYRGNSPDYPHLPGEGTSFVRKFDRDGNFLWADDFGLAGKNYRATGISADRVGNVYVSGAFSSAIYDGGNGTAFLRKYDSTGHLLWNVTLGNTADNADINVSTDALGNIFVAGVSTDFSGRYDTSLMRVRIDGVVDWRIQRNSNGVNAPHDVQTDGLGNVFIGGGVFSDVESGIPNGIDAFLLKYDSHGVLLASELLSTEVHDVGYGVGVDRAGNAYLTGYTLGSLAANHPEYATIFIAKFRYLVPEPKAIDLIAAVFASLLLYFWRHQKFSLTTLG